MSNKPKEKTQERKAAKALGVRFTDEELAAMCNSMEVEPGEFPDATIVRGYVRRQLRLEREGGKRRARA